MSFLRKTLIFTALSLSTLAIAQTNNSAPELEQSSKTFGSWTLECVTYKDKKEECVIFQTAKEPKEGKAEILRLTVGRFEKDKIGVILSAPLEVALIPGIVIKLIDKDSKESNLQALITDKDKKEQRKDIEGLSYERCMPSSCISGFPLDKIEIDRLKKGKAINVTLAASPDPKDNVTVSLSLTGFTAAIDAMLAKK